MVVVPMVVPKFFQWLGPKVPMEPRAFSFHIPMDFSVCTCKLEFHWRTSMDSWFQCSREFFFEFEWLVCDAKTYLGINQRVDQIRNFFCFLASSEFSHCLCFFQWMDPKECMVLAWKKIRIIIYLKNLFFFKSHLLCTSFLSSIIWILLTFFMGISGFCRWLIPAFVRHNFIISMVSFVSSESLVTLLISSRWRWSKVRIEVGIQWRGFVISEKLSGISVGF